jgi:SHS2 domain-containing protein
MNDRPAGFIEMDHIADWELKVWAPDLPGLLEQAARGMYALAGLTPGPGSRCRRDLEIQSHDPEGLLVNFLGELLYFSTEQGLVFDQFQIKIVKNSQPEGYQCAVGLAGAPASSPGKDIKAVTYHKMNIEQGPRGFEVRIVFDV